MNDEVNSAEASINIKVSHCPNNHLIFVDYNYTKILRAPDETSQ